MKLQSTIKTFGIFAIALGATTMASFAGSKSYASKTEVAAPPMDEPCFTAGDFSLDLFAGYVWNQDDDSDDADAATGGIGLNYFFTEMIGVGADAYWYDHDGAIHNFDGSLIVRFPIQEICLAPYIYGGGGYRTNSHNEGSYHAGAGVEWKASDTLGIFADGRYTWLEDSGDTALARLGVRLHF